MTDKELTELAAIAFGFTDVCAIEAHKSANDDSSTWIALGINRYGKKDYFSPLYNNHDAFSLSVHLRMCIEHNHAADHQLWVSASIDGCELCFSPHSSVVDEFEEKDRQDATRASIVNTAAKFALEFYKKGQS